MSYSTVYQFKITLKEVRPPVWRRIQVPSTYTFWGLHVAIQDAMGWGDYHLHEFEILNPKTGIRDQIGIPDFDWGNDCLPGWEERIAAYFSPDNPQAIYMYDFGDGWEHTVVLEEILPREAELDYPRCTGGKRACPPEDCGGPYGYEMFLEAIQDPEHEEHDEMLEWVGGSFDPERFDPQAVSFDDPEKRWEFAFGDRQY